MEVMFRVFLCQKHSRKPTGSKMENLRFCSYIHTIVRVGPPQTRPKFMKILSRSALFESPEIDSEIDRFLHQKLPHKRPLKSKHGPAGRPLGTPKGPPGGLPGTQVPKLMTLGVDFGAYLTPRASNLSQNRRSGRPRGPSPSYIV